MVKSSDEGEPFTLDLRASLNKELISRHHFVSDNFKRVLEVLLFLLKAVFLLLDEFLQWVELFLNLSQSSCMNFFKLFIDLHLILLEFLNLFKNFLAFTSASVDEGICSSTPVETLDTWLDSSIKEIKMLFEK